MKNFQEMRIPAVAPPLDDVSRLCRAADERLWVAWSNAKNQSYSPDRTQIVYPSYGRNGGIRASEQEARLAFIESLIGESSHLFSIETPTNELYSFSGNQAVSAQTDLALHNDGGGIDLRVEFKAKGYSPDRQDKHPIFKDMQKLLREKAPGLWFHVLENVDLTTIDKLLAVLTEGIASTVDQHSIQNNQLGIHVCILYSKSYGTGFSVEQWHTVEPDNLRTLQFSPKPGWMPKSGDVIGEWHINCPSSK